MSYCLNPDCQKPHNPSDAKFCLKCGTKLLLGDRYRSIELMGQGRFGRTLLAVDECKPSKPNCIVKQFFSQAQGTENAEEAAQLFEQKAVRLEELGTHPQIPELLAHFAQNQYHYLVQDFIDGQNLAQDLESHGAFNEFQIRQLLKDILPVLQFVHERNVIHRDIKPKNIIRRITSSIQTPANSISSELTEAEGTIANPLVLVDFGAAKFATDNLLPPTGTVIGTSGFVAPEQALGKGTFASDIYSLGVTCIHLLTQKSPFELYSVSEGGWVWREHVSNPVTQGLGRILDKMLENATKRRYQNAGDVLDEVNLLESASAAATISITPPKSSPQLQPSVPVQPEPLVATEPELQVPSQTEPLVATEPELQVPSQTEPLVATEPEPKHLAIAEPAAAPLSQNWKCVQTLTGHSDGGLDWYAGVTCLAFNPAEKWIVSGSEDHTIKVWELSTGKELRTLAGHAGFFVRSIAIRPDEELLASAGDDIIKLWDLETGEEIRTLSGHSSVIQRLVFSPDGQVLISAGNDKTIKIWNPDTGEVMRTLGGNHLIEALSISPDGQIIASGDGDLKAKLYTVKLWNFNTGEEIRTFSGHSNTIRAVAFSPDGQLLASGSCDKTIKIWQVETGALLHTLTGHSGWFAAVNSVAFSPDGKILASGSDDKTIKLWNTETGKTILTLSRHSKGVNSVVFSADGQTLASGSGDKTVKIWRCD
ncbi:protein kinase domain-containing protein [Allocoleopsis franciscana]|uniref:WD40 repeat-containing protein n=1 Tax=Allocoleopsis franciscana PCC 7113 TaxID=1173027 RepID=K9WHT4_9CYAN|nr:protein kinase [Allocoleopsis franciscana]AFZ19753.1 WD40 repeat-containing protein [Allocoleopsis franciscana PCC 7113]